MAQVKLKTLRKLVREALVKEANRDWDHDDPSTTPLRFRSGDTGFGGRRHEPFVPGRMPDRDEVEPGTWVDPVATAAAGEPVSPPDTDRWKSFDQVMGLLRQAQFGGTLRLGSGDSSCTVQIADTENHRMPYKVVVNDGGKPKSTSFPTNAKAISFAKNVIKQKLDAGFTPTLAESYSVDFDDETASWGVFDDDGKMLNTYSDEGSAEAEASRLSKTAPKNDMVKEAEDEELSDMYEPMSEEQIVKKGRKLDLSDKAIKYVLDLFEHALDVINQSDELFEADCFDEKGRLILGQEHQDVRDHLAKVMHARSNGEVYTAFNAFFTEG